MGGDAADARAPLAARRRRAWLRRTRPSPLARRRIPRERQRDVRGAIRARGVRAAPRDGHRVPPLARRRGGAVRQLDRRHAVGRRDRRARILPPRTGPTPRRRLGRRRGRRDRRANVERTKNVNRPNRRAPPPSSTRRGRHHRQSQANSETARHRGGVHARVQARARLLDRGRGAANLVAILRLAHHSSESRRRDGPLRVGSARRRAGAQDPTTIPRCPTNPSGGVEAVRADR
mmetsp:Transcript_10798/g.49757  ORF Transcript_10798/g.49757 Transcript_10798/m.49757 type:complete len:233 (-) Transcript_10798:649-1347(-)